MELPSVAALEFNQLRASIKNYIKTKSDFTDYDFEGSNLSMLVDILAYNTLYTTYNINMASNELNLDTAVLRDNIVSHAKKLGYTPGSYTSSKASIDITVSNLSAFNISRISLRSGPVLSTTYQNKNYTFVTKEPINLDVSGLTSAVFRDVEVVEGSTFTISYTVDTSNENQRFILPNNYIDADSVKVYVKADSTATTSTQYERKNTIVGISQSDTIFFVEEIQDQKYEIIFGDDVIGRKLQNGEIVTIEYIITAGGELNNVKESSLKFIGTVEFVDANNVPGKVALSDITFSLNTEFTDGGSSFEDISSIKYRAPRYYASQGRAVTISDYESLIMQLYGNADLVKVVGGETLTPPQYGKVFITIKPKVGEVVSNSEKDRIVKDLKSYIVGSITPVIRDPKKYKILLSPYIVYNKNKTRKTSTTLQRLIRDLIVEFENSDTFKNFGGVYSDSNLISDIQNIDSAITFANIKTKLCVEIDLNINNRIETLYSGSFFTKINPKLNSKYAVVSDYFCVPGFAEPLFLGVLSFGESNCVIDSNIYLIDSEGNLIRSVGTIDFETGKFSFSVASCQDNPINICAIPETPNLDVDEETYPDIVIDQVNIIDFGDEDPEDLGPFTEVPTNSPDGISGDPEVPTDGGVGTTIDDPNNIITINDFTPETDPNKCS